MTTDDTDNVIPFPRRRQIEVPAPPSGPRPDLDQVRERLDRIKREQETRP